MTLRRSAPRGAAALLCCVAAAAGCEGGGGSPAVMVTDSAGIQIVESAAPAWRDAVGWTILPEPDVQIGVVEGDLPYEFQRVAGAIRLANGSIVIADGGTNEVRIFDAGGRHVRSVGRTGQGPGEYEYIRGLMSCGGDAIYAFDLNWQLKVYDTAGALQREHTMLQPGVSRSPYALSCSSSGNFVMSGWGDMMAQPGFYQATSPVYVLDGSGGVLSELGEFISSERIASERGSRPHPFGRAVSFAMNDDEVYVGTGEAMQLLVYGLDGELRRIVRGPSPDLAIRSEHVAAYRESVMRNVREAQRAATERELRDMPMPERFPAFTETRMARDGHVWLRRFVPPGGAGAPWSVFAADGAYLGDVEMPEGLRVTEIGGDYVLGVHRDDMDVERVRLYRIGKR